MSNSAIDVCIRTLSHLGLWLCASVCMCMCFYCSGFPFTLPRSVCARMRNNNYEIFQLCFFMEVKCQIASLVHFSHTRTHFVVWLVGWPIDWCAWFGTLGAPVCANTHKHRGSGPFFIISDFFPEEVRLTINWWYRCCGLFFFSSSSSQHLSVTVSTSSYNMMIVDLKTKTRKKTKQNVLIDADWQGRRANACDNRHVCELCFLLIAFDLLVFFGSVFVNVIVSRCIHTERNGDCHYQLNPFLLLSIGKKMEKTILSIYIY